LFLCCFLSFKLLVLSVCNRAFSRKIIGTMLHGIIAAVVKLHERDEMEHNKPLGRRK
jgi:hypothetical protein